MVKKKSIYTKRDPARIDERTSFETEARMKTHTRPSWLHARRYVDNSKREAERENEREREGKKNPTPNTMLISENMHVYAHTVVLIINEKTGERARMKARKNTKFPTIYWSISIIFWWVHIDFWFVPIIYWYFPIGYLYNWT